MGSYDVLPCGKFWYLSETNSAIATEHTFHVGAHFRMWQKPAYMNLQLLAQSDKVLTGNPQSSKMLYKGGEVNYSKNQHIRAYSYRLSLAVFLSEIYTFVKCWEGKWNETVVFSICFLEKYLEENIRFCNTPCSGCSTVRLSLHP